MRKFLLLLFLLALGAIAYAYIQDPKNFAKSASKLETDVLALFVAGGDLVTKPPPASDATSSDESTSDSPDWSPPAVIPAHDGWTWTTPDKIYKNVKITKIEADCVTITHQDGTAVVQTWTLPSDIQKQLNYDPAAATAASAKHPHIAQTPQGAGGNVVLSEIAPALPMSDWETDDFDMGVAQARATHRKVLLYFTGSDWCPACQQMDREVISTSDFRHFVSQNYIMVTLDFPHHSALSDDEKQKNDQVAGRFGVSGFPTLIAITTDGKELMRTVGCPVGDGAVDDMISHFKSALQQQ
jgi:thiol-disulfide isomerase/thioredoxin